MANDEGTPKGTRTAAEDAEAPENAEAPEHAEAPENAEDDGDRRPDDKGAPWVVGIGASAGGLEALTLMLGEIPADAQAAFVVVVHLDPDRESLLAELLAARTALTVVAAADGDVATAGRVHVIEPGTELTLVNGRLRAVPPPTPTNAARRSTRSSGRWPPTAAIARSASCCQAPAAKGRSACRRSKRAAASLWCRSRRPPRTSRCRARPRRPGWSTTSSRCRRCGRSAAPISNAAAPALPFWPRSRRPKPSCARWRPCCAPRPATTSRTTSRTRCCDASTGVWRCSRSPTSTATCTGCEPTRRRSRGCFGSCSSASQLLSRPGCVRRAGAGAARDAGGPPRRPAGAGVGAGLLDR